MIPNHLKQPENTPIILEPRDFKHGRTYYSKFISDAEIDAEIEEEIAERLKSLGGRYGKDDSD